MLMTWWNRVRLTPFLLVVPALLVAQTQTPRPAGDVPVFDRETPDRYAADVPAHIAIVDGAATLEREGRRVTAEENTPLLAGDRLRTQRGRVEVLYEDGSVIDIDQFSTLDLMADSILRLMAGRIRVSL